MEGRAFWKKQGRTWPLVLAAVLSVVFLSAAAYLLLFGYNHFSLELATCQGTVLLTHSLPEDAPAWFEIRRMQGVRADGLTPGSC